ncbi:hypothetical protein C8Q79DRAFT_573718 [Trametes meyenii]|nr:hypothetical protein C8Q79DRAFT_573718 [Trametes meyenii]
MPAAERLTRNTDVMGSFVQRAGGSVPPADTPPPMSANLAEGRPEIGGSFGGFIAVVVALATIFVISCVGIFILLRNHEPTPYERQLRKARSRRRDFSSEAPIGPSGIRERLARLFGRRRGWIKASGEDGDEWDASDDRVPNHPGDRDLRERDRARGELPATLGAGRPRAGESVAPSLSSDSVEVELSAPSAYVPFPSPGPSLGASLFPDTDDEDAPSIRSAPVSMPVSQSPPSISPPQGEIASLGQRDERHFSVQSGSAESDHHGVYVRSMRKFDNGTKFKESL